jgi:hypothetical protein
MTTLLVSPKNHSELDLVTKLLRKLGIDTRALSEEEKEDMGLAVLMKKANRSKKVSRETIMKKLRG